jgi:hypothetical protein
MSIGVRIGGVAPISSHQCPCGRIKALYRDYHIGAQGTNALASLPCQLLVCVGSS